MCVERNDNMKITEQNIISHHFPVNRTNDAAPLNISNLFVNCLIVEQIKVKLTPLWRCSKLLRIAGFAVSFFSHMETSRIDKVERFLILYLRFWSHTLSKRVRVCLNSLSSQMTSRQFAFDAPPLRQKTTTLKQSCPARHSNDVNG